MKDLDQKSLCYLLTPVVKVQWALRPWAADHLIVTADRFMGNDFKGTRHWVINIC